MSALDDIRDTADAHGWAEAEVGEDSWSFIKNDHEVMVYVATNGRVVSFSHTFQGRAQDTDAVDQREQIQTIMRVL